MNTALNSILDLFEENELNISKLYGIYGNKIEGHKRFWQRLSKDEIRHANEIRESYQNKDNIFRENNFVRGAIKYVTDFVKQQIEYAIKNKISHADALNIALRIEQSILEKKMFEIFAPTDITVKKIMNRLNRETDQHAKIIRKEIRKNKA